METTLPTEDIKEVLATQVLGHLACCEGDKPYVVPMAYAYKANVLYGLTTEGRKIDILRSNPNCCFQVGDRKGKYWRSVLCEGVFEELDFASVTDPDAIAAVTLLVKRLQSVQDVVGIDVPMETKDSLKPLNINGKQATLFRIVIDSLTGRSGKTGD